MKMGQNHGHVMVMDHMLFSSIALEHSFSFYENHSSSCNAIEDLDYLPLHIEN